MAALQCEICGGKLMGRPGGVFECESCGMQYDTAWAKAKVQEIKGTVKVEGPVEVRGSVKVEGPVEVKGGVSAENFVKRGQLAMEVHQWLDAAVYFNQALNINAECADAHLGKFCAHFNNADIHQLIGRFGAECLQYADFHNALRFMAPAAAAKLREEVEKAEQRLQEQKRKKAEQEKAISDTLERIKEQEERLKKAAGTLVEKRRANAAAQLAPVRERIRKAQGLISAGGHHTVALQADGSAVAVGSNAEGQCNVGLWRDLVAVAAGGWHTVGLKADGTVVATGSNSKGQCDVAGWRKIVAVSAGDCHTVGLKADGTVVITGDDLYEQIDISKWRDIVAISAGSLQTVGLMSDGTAVTTDEYAEDSRSVREWKDIAAVSAGFYYSVGVKKYGSVVTAENEYDDYYDQSAVDKWGGIVAISAGERHIAALKADGTVAATAYYPQDDEDDEDDEEDDDGRCDVGKWSDIIAISAGTAHTVGLRSDGGVVAAGCNSCGQCNVSAWKLFQNFDNLDQERAEEKEKLRLSIQKQRDEALRVIQHRRSVGRCQHCGGEFKGLFSKKCARCGKMKDY